MFIEKFLFYLYLSDATVDLTDDFKTKQKILTRKVLFFYEKRKMHFHIVSDNEALFYPRHKTIIIIM